MRAYNFSAGPAILPEEVLQQAQAEFVDYQSTGMSIMEMSHRGKEYSAVHDETITNIKELLQIPEGYSVLFMTGGATAQFALAPMNLASKGKIADYTNSGTWATKAIKEAKLIGNVNVVADCAKEIPTRVPTIEECQLNPDAAYLLPQMKPSLAHNGKSSLKPKSHSSLICHPIFSLAHSTSKILASSTPVHKKPRTCRYNTRHYQR